MEHTPTSQEWQLLRRLPEVKGLFPSDKAQRHAPVHINVPREDDKGTRYRTCVTTCLKALSQTTNRDWEITFGLKVYVATDPLSGAFLGVKAPVHAVLRKKVDGTPKFKYKDPSPEVGETQILFIPIPSMFTDIQRDCIVAAPGCARLGAVLFDFGSLPYAAACRAASEHDAMLAKEKLSRLMLVVLREDRAYTVDAKGTWQEFNP